MKKSFLLLPLAAFVLVGCSSTSTSSETETTTATPEWQATDSIQVAEMPSSMTQPTIQQPTYNQPSYSAPQPTVGNYGNSTEIIGNCQVVRDAYNKPVYSQIQKGCYTGSTYTVSRDETLFLIGYLTGQTAGQVASLNGISVDTKLKVGQVLRVR